MWIELFAKPHDPRPHQGMTTGTLRKFVRIPLGFAKGKITVRTTRDEDIAVYSSRFFLPATARLRCTRVCADYRRFVSRAKSRVIAAQVSQPIHARRWSAQRECVAGARDTIPKPAADRARMLPVWPTAPDRGFASNPPSRERSGCRSRRKYLRRSQPERARNGYRSTFPNPSRSGGLCFVPRATLMSGLKYSAMARVEMSSPVASFRTLRQSSVLAFFQNVVQPGADFLVVGVVT